VVLNAHIVREWDTPWRTVTLYVAFLTRVNISKLEGFEPKFSNEKY